MSDQPPPGGQDPKEKQGKDEGLASIMMQYMQQQQQMLANQQQLMQQGQAQARATEERVNALTEEVRKMRAERDNAQAAAGSKRSRGGGDDDGDGRQGPDKRPRPNPITALERPRGFLDQGNVFREIQSETASGQRGLNVVPWNSVTHQRFGRGGAGEAMVSKDYPGDVNIMREDGHRNLQGLFLGPEGYQRWANECQSRTWQKGQVWFGSLSPVPRTILQRLANKSLGSASFERQRAEEAAAAAAAKAAQEGKIQCGNCGRYGHELADCQRPDKKHGSIVGCPMHNTKKHFVDTCEADWTVEQMVEYFLLRRANLPALRTEKYSWLKFLIRDLNGDEAAKVVHYPWTDNFAVEMLLNELFMASVERGELVPLEKRPVDPKTKDDEAVVARYEQGKYGLYNRAVALERYKKRTETPKSGPGDASTLMNVDGEEEVDNNGDGADKGAAVPGEDARMTGDDQGVDRRRTDREGDVGGGDGHARMDIDGQERPQRRFENLVRAKKQPKDTPSAEPDKPLNPKFKSLLEKSKTKKQQLQKERQLKEDNVWYPPESDQEMEIGYSTLYKDSFGDWYEEFGQRFTHFASQPKEVDLDNPPRTPLGYEYNPSVNTYIARYEQPALDRRPVLHPDEEGLARSIEAQRVEMDLPQVRSRGGPERMDAEFVEEYRNRAKTSRPMGENQ